MTKMTRKQISVAYWGNLVQADIAKGKTLATIRGELRYVVEYSEVLGVSDIETIIEIGQGKRTA